MARNHGIETWIKVSAVAGVVAAAAAVLAELPPSGDSSQGQQELPATEGTVETTTLTTSTTTPSSMETAEVQAQDPNVRTLVFFDLDKDDLVENCEFVVNRWRHESGVINGTTYPRSVIWETDRYPAGDSCFATYNIGTHYHWFKAMIGVEDSTPSVVRFQVRILAEPDGELLHEGKYRVGDAVDEVSLKVTDALHLRLEVFVLAPTAQTERAQGTIVFGDARVTP